MTAKVPFTKSTVEKAKPPKHGRRYLYDTRQPGLALCITPSGSRTFYLCFREGGKPKRTPIGKFPSLTVQQARQLVRDEQYGIAHGDNPVERKRRERGEPTLGDLCDWWMHHAKERKRTWREDERIMKNFLAPWRGRRAAMIRTEHVRQLHSRIGRENGRYAANRLLSLLRAIFNHAANTCGYEIRNPTKGVKKFHEESRDRYLEPDELPRFFKALLAYPDETLRDFFLTALLTGARRGNVQSMKWKDVNLDAGTWRIPKTKSGEPVLVHLSPLACNLLRTRRETISGTEYVFPSHSKAGHLVEVKTAWARILKAAGIENLRVHDLRRTLGSWQALTGASLPVIGKSLGHKNQSTTAIYARLGIEPVRESVNRATSAMLTAAGLQTTKGADNGQTKAE